MSSLYNSIKKENSDNQQEISSFVFSNALKNVIQTMTSIEISETRVINDDAGDIFQISGVILMVGQKNIMLSLTVSSQMAYTLISFMTGIQREELKVDDLYDGISEITNMVAGEVRAYMSTRGVQLTTFAPFAIAGKQFTFIYKNKIPNIIKQYHSNNEEIKLRVYFL